MGTERFRSRRGQALVELAVGMLAVSLVLSALFAFSNYILSSLAEQRSLRAEAGRSALNATGGDESYVSAMKTTTITVSPMAADYIFGSREVDIKEEVHIPVMHLQTVQQ